MSPKKEIRKHMKELLSKQTESDIREKSERIRNSLKKLGEYKDAKTILFYVSIEKEVSTREIIAEAISDGKSVVVPKVNHKTKIMTLHRISHLEELSPGYIGILEPIGKPEVFPTSGIDLAVIPGIAFDERGHRLGRGGAFFDRLLKHVECPKIALGFDFQIIDSIPTLPHDVPIDVVITEKRVINVFNIRI